MKSYLIVAALLAGLAAPALAEEAVTPPPSQTQAAISPSQEAPALPDALPQSKAVEVVPMSVPLESNSPPPSRGGGCGHAKTTVYLTN